MRRGLSSGERSRKLYKISSCTIPEARYARMLCRVIRVSRIVSLPLRTAGSIRMAPVAHTRRVRAWPAQAEEAEEDGRSVRPPHRPPVGNYGVLRYQRVPTLIPIGCMRLSGAPVRMFSIS